ncbi:HAD family hydrolase [Salinispora pacifica]|uniref:HAD family hydrolase n=1 Tax=Salinispora pacifica TaxID=351187 RepID=UPI0012BD817D|nr:HAD-IA family hydrolase [Salinispora pacifica]
MRRGGGAVPGRASVRAGRRCSNGPRASSQQKLSRAGLTQFVTAVICAPDSGIAKPHAAAFRACSRALNVHPTRCLHIGDNWQTDIQGAQTAGLIPIWISHQPTDIPPHPATVPRYGTPPSPTPSATYFTSYRPPLSNDVAD